MGLRRFLTAFFWLLAAAGAAQAQTISPVIVEYKEKAKGKFELMNDSVLPLNVVIDPRSFSVDAEGHPTFRPLDADVKVRLSAMSFRLAPRQTYTVFYEVETPRLPTWVCIYAVVTGATTPTGIKLALELPHTVYVLPKKPLERDSVVVVRSTVSGDARQIEAEVENRGQEFDRVQEVEVVSGSTRRSFPGFPFFPGQRRILRFEWDQPGKPEKMVLKFARFRVEQVLAASASP
jgi:hypothetical protein